MDIVVIAKTIDVIGKLLIAYAAIRVHHRFWKEHKVDEKVFAVMRIEQKLGILGVILIISAYALEVLFVL